MLLRWACRPGGGGAGAGLAVGTPGRQLAIRSSARQVLQPGCHAPRPLQLLPPACPASPPHRPLQVPYLAVTAFTLGAYWAHPYMQQASYWLHW